MVIVRSVLGGPVPPDTPHAVSVFLPTWEDNVDYEKGAPRIVEAMETGYPRFFIHKSIQNLAAEIVNRFGVPADGQSKENLTAMLFPSARTAAVCADFMKSQLAASEKPEDARHIRVLNLYMPESGSSKESSTSLDNISSDLFCVIYPKEFFGLAKQVWQHTGQGISSRRSEFCLKALESGYLSPKQRQPCGDCWAQKGPKRYQRNMGPVSPSFSDSSNTESTEFELFVEERFGRNLDITLADQAKLAVRRRIAGSLTAADVELDVAMKSAPSQTRIAGLTEDDVYLYPNGMNAIFNIHQTLMKARGEMKSICYGFPYIDTLKILQKWGPGVEFYGHCSNEELDELEGRLEAGERYLALFMEFPGNPLLKAPNIKRIRSLADKYDFAIVIDESLGNYVNVNVLPYADVVASSLTKVFSGDSNVMGGSAVLNPNRRYHKVIKEILEKEFEDNYWAEDAIFLERNSRDFVSRIHRMNAATVAMVEQLRASPLVKDIYYPLYNDTRPYYEDCKNPEGGYGGLFSVVFHSANRAVAYYDAFDVLKGPSLGTNFTLCSPYTILAHFAELDWAASYGVPAHLVRIAVGLEDPSDLKERVERALSAAAAVSP